MKSCWEIHRLVSEGQDRKFGFGERLAVRMHLLMCSACRRFERQMKLMRQALRRFPGE